MEITSTNTGTGLLILEKVTPVIISLFGLFHLSRIKKYKNRVYISRRATNDVSWSKIQHRLNRVLPDLGLHMPKESHCITYYLRELILQMRNNPAYTDDQVLYLEHVVCMEGGNGYAEFEQLFKIALALDDGHGLQSIHYESAWHGKGFHLFQFSGEGLYATKDAAVVADVGIIMQFARDLSDELEDHNLESASKIVCEYIAHLLADIFNHKQRDQLIHQVGKDITQIASEFFDAASEDEGRCGEMKP